MRFPTLEYIPPLFITIFALVSLVVINRRYRKNPLKRFFSFVLLAISIDIILFVLRDFYVAYFSILTKIILSFNIFIIPSFFIFSVIVYKGKMIKRLYLIYLLSFILLLTLWLRTSVKMEDSTYTISPIFSTPYAIFSASLLFSSIICWYKTYRGSQSHMRRKLFLFFLASLIPLCVFAITSYFITSSRMDIHHLIYQSYPISIMVGLIVYAYLWG